MALFQLVGTMFGAYLAFLMWKVQRGQKAAAVEVRKVRVRTSRNEKKRDATAAGQNEALAGIAITSSLNHDLLNGGLGVQLRLTAALTRRLAEEHPDDMADAEAAVTAARLLAEHEVKLARTRGVPPKP